MIVHFGLQLDGMQPAPPATLAGEIGLGPARLLDLLELRLGLPPVRARPGEALLAYQACLAELDDTTRFYHRSFEVDPLGVANTLLAWRARWYEAGWSGGFSGSVSKRLSDLAEIETLASRRVPLTHGQRLQRIRAALDDGLEAQIERVVLHTEQEALPAAWRAVLERFDADVAAGVNASPCADSGTDLHRVQRGLLDLAGRPPGEPSRGGSGGGETGEGEPRARGTRAGDVPGETRRREALAGDDSLIVVRGISRDLSAQAVGEYLRKLQAPDDTVVIAPRDGIIVDNGLERVGLPRAGFQHYSRFRAVTQALKLCLALVWEPVSPHALMQFLIHPVGPLPGHVRSELAAAVAAEPGIGGTAWRGALAAVAERLRTRFEHSQARIDALLADIAYWLECERYPAADGAPLDVLIERTQRCTQWLAGRVHGARDDTEIELLAAAQAQSEALSAALADLHRRGDGRIRRIALEQLVDEVSAHAADPGTFAQAGHVRAAADPAAITRSWRTVVWWDLAPDAPSRAWPWSEAELAQLAREGVALPSVEARIRARVRGWLRPVLNARSQLVLVVHDREEGHHPLWSRLVSLFERFNEIRIEDALLDSGTAPSGGAARAVEPPDAAAEPLGDSHGPPARAAEAPAAIPALWIPTEPLALQPLPEPRRWWALPADCRIPPRGIESFSSLNKLIYYPHEWVLSYAARLYRGRAGDLTTGNLLHGNLAHRLFERFFDTHPEWAGFDERAARAWLGANLPKLLAEEGALLCEPGAGVLREQVVTTLESAFVRLLGHLRSAGIRSAVAEQAAEAPFKDVKLGGTVDLVLAREDGREIVLDVKWGGQERRGEALAENRYLQLATYAYLRREAARAGGTTGGAGDWPYYAYYIVSTGNIVAPDASVFPGAVTFPPAVRENIAALWARIGAAYDWRRAQIAAGRIEVNVHGTAPEGPDSVPPPDALDTAVEPDYFDDFTWLTGWQDGP